MPRLSLLLGAHREHGRTLRRAHHRRAWARHQGREGLCVCDLLSRHGPSVLETSASGDSHDIEMYLGSLDTLLGLVWRLTVLLDLVMAELPGLDRDCCLHKMSGFVSSVVT